MNGTDEPERKPYSYIRGSERYANGITLEAVRRIRFGADLKVYIAIVSHANRAGVAWPSRSTLARETGLGSVTVSRAIKRLALAGVLMVDERPGTSNHYFLAAPEDHAELAREAPGYDAARPARYSTIPDVA